MLGPASNSVTLDKFLFWASASSVIRMMMMVTVMAMMVIILIIHQYVVNGFCLLIP